MSGQLKWRWHYLFYVALWGHALWRTVHTLTAAYTPDSHGMRATAGRFSGVEDEAAGDYDL